MDPLRAHLVALLKGGQAFDTFDQIVHEFTDSEAGLVPKGAEHSAWQIVEHMRITLKDILDFSQNEDGRYHELAWPAEYWPVATHGNWTQTCAEYQMLVGELIRVIQDQNRDLFAPFPWGDSDGQTLLREAMLAAEHQAYHLGQLVELKRWLLVSA